MNRSKFTKREIQLIKNNPYTYHVTEAQICYTKEFKEEFWRRYQTGETPRAIVEALGLSIRVKLMGGFLVLAVLLVVVGWLGTLAMNAVSARSDKMMANNVQDIQDLHLMKVSLLNVRSEVQRAVLYADAEKTKAAIESIEAYQVENQKILIHI
jgi:hypothetical protein